MFARSGRKGSERKTKRTIAGRDKRLNGKPLSRNTKTVRVAKPCQKEAMWYVIWAIAKKENALIERIGQTVPREVYQKAWTPMKTEWRKYRGEVVLKDVKLFPGYVLIDTKEPDTVYRYLYKEKNFIKFLKSGDDYAPVTEDEQTIILHLTKENGTAGMSVGFIRDGVLKVLDGPLKGMEDYVVKIDRHHRKAWVRFEHMLGQDRVLSFGLEVVGKT